MGSLRMGPPTELILQLRSLFALNEFVETGTFMGGTAVWASQHFDQVYTVELAKSIYEGTVARNGHIENIAFLNGDSRMVLPEIIAKLKGAAIFWLDGHYSGEDTAGYETDCPIMDEIEHVQASDQPHVILIDDARLLMAPLQSDDEVDRWPTIDRVLNKLHEAKQPRYVVIIEDVIISVPLEAKSVVIKYCQDVGRRDLAQRSMPQKQVAIDHIRTGVKILAKPLTRRIKKVRRSLSS